MVPFQALTLPSQNNNQTSSIPNITQVYTSHYIDFEANKIYVPSTSSVDGTTTIPPHVPLAYHAISDKKNDPLHINQYLGVWTCRIPSPSEVTTTNNAVSPTSPSSGTTPLAQLLLKNVALKRPRRSSNEGDSGQNKDGVDGDYTTPTVLFTVNLTDPSRVAHDLRAMQNAVTGCFDDDDDDATPEKNTTSSSSPTTLAQTLRDCPFGAANTTKPPTSTASSSSPRLSIVICGLLPPSPPLTFKEKQEQSLVNYHLHRWAWILDATLAFVKMDGVGDDNAATAPPVVAHVDVRRVCEVLNGLASGGGVLLRTEGNEDEAKEATKEEEEEEEETEVEEDVVDTGLFLPEMHDENVIEGVMLRNVSCEYWDAKVDNLEKALPWLPPKTEAKAVSEISDEEEWLEKLARTGYKAGVTAAAAAGGVGGAGEGANPGKGKVKGKGVQKEKVSSFFQDLLKKK